MNSAWSLICENLQKTLEPGFFKVWIAPLEGEVLDCDLSLKAPNEYAANWVRDRLSPAILTAASEALGKEAAELNLTVQAGAAQPAQRILPADSVPARPSSGQIPLIVPNRPAQARWRFSFDDFVVGPCNEMAFAAAKGLCADLAGAGTLFLSSASGLGKTHLAQAMGKCLSEDARSWPGECSLCPKVNYLTAEEFASRFVAALKARDAENFKERLRQSEVLLLEDVHFLQNKEKMQEEILALIKSLQARGSRIVLTSSFAPRELHRMDSRLVSLFCSGLLTHMAGPDLETRRKIVCKKAHLHQVILPKAVSELLATRITGDVRRLESCLNTLVFKARLVNSLISLDMAAEMVRQYEEEQGGFDMDGIIRLVCAGFKLSPAQLASRSRKSEYVQARNTIYYLARKHTELSLQEIGDHFHRRHSSVIKGISVMEREMQRETPLGRRLAGAVALIERNAGIEP